MPQDWFKCLEKKEAIVSVFVCNGKAEEAEKRALTSPHQHLVQGDQKFLKITVEEPLEDLENENIETWQKLQQEKTNESLTCCFCQGSSVELVENVQT